MKISTKGRYALRLMLDLAMSDSSRPTHIKEISARQDISVKYLEQIIAILNKAGFVRSTRGPQGGYSLRWDPEEYTVGMILRLTEGSLAPVACVEDGGICPRDEQCVTVEVWKRLNDAINGVVDHITLADLIHWQEEKNQNLDYII
ncbi:MAG: Rrf2 family transcriptional regulator [Lachnospiraceae bacterium]|nr:Rrf2 family transcriptional regulator [Lachnospiraceae bacterium]MDD3615150.1 Rrf2 family transcriptional regulator [Lachnospiraceae bacterium]